MQTVSNTRARMLAIEHIRKFKNPTELIQFKLKRFENVKPRIETNNIKIKRLSVPVDQKIEC